jgi:hypothetical protein
MSRRAGRSSHANRLVRPGPLALVLGFVAVSVVSRTAHAYRPFDGTDADVAGLGEFELELGPAFYRQDRASYLIAPSGVLNLGIATRLELVVDFKNFVALGTREPGVRRVQLRDTDVMAKVLLRRGFLQGREGPSVAVELGPLLPDPGTSNGFGTEGDFIVSLADEMWAAHFNGAMAGNRQHDLELFGSVIVEGWRNLRGHPVAEILVDHISHEGSQFSLLLGGQWSLRRDVTFDLAGRSARIDGTTAWEIRLGLTWSTRVWDGESFE